MAKRQRTEERGCQGTAKRPAPERKKHLYLLLDDWERCYSVRRMDVDDFNSDGVFAILGTFLNQIRYLQACFHRNHFSFLQNILRAMHPDQCGLCGQIK